MPKKVENTHKCAYFLLAYFGRKVVFINKKRPKNNIDRSEVLITQIHFCCIFQYCAVVLAAGQVDTDVIENSCSGKRQDCQHN